MIIPFTCPTCHGHKTVSKPPWVAGDQMTWVSGGTEIYPCPSCNGSGVIWNEQKDFDPKFMDLINENFWELV